MAPPEPANLAEAPTLRAVMTIRRFSSATLKMRSRRSKLAFTSSANLRLRSEVEVETRRSRPLWAMSANSDMAARTLVFFASKRRFTSLWASPDSSARCAS